MSHSGADADEGDGADGAHAGDGSWAAERFALWLRAAVAGSGWVA